MKKLLFISALLFSITGHSQVISRFTWSTAPLTHAAIGPDAISVNSTAYQSAVGAPVNYAINPGTPTKDIDLTVPGSPYFDVPGIDIDLYFRREESEASFFMRGSGFNFGMNNGQLYVNFTTSKGSNPGTLTVSSGSVFAVPDDHAFHHYRFLYDNNSGIATIYADNAVVYTYTGTPGYSLSWVSTANVVIGSKMDATGRNIAVLGNMTIQNPALAASLPVSLLSFNAAVKNEVAVIDWSTTKELNVEKFIVESSADGASFSPLTSVVASGSYDLAHRYQIVDATPYHAAVYYRLKMVDIDGRFTCSEIRKLNFTTGASATCFPNPATDHVMLSLTNAKAGDAQYTVFSLNGNIVRVASVHIESGSQLIRIDLAGNMPAGALIIRLVNGNDHTVHSFKIIKG